MAPQDIELIGQFQRGNMAAFDQLVHRYDKQVLSIAGSYVNNIDDAKDIYQEVFLRVYKGLPKFEHRSEFSTWLYRITTNVCLTFRSRRKKHSIVSLDQEHDHGDDQTGSLSESIPDGPPTDQHALSSEIAFQVENALNTLSPQQKLVFTLRHYQGYKLKDIASMMGCAEGTVKKYLFTATQRMRDQLKEVFE